MRYYETLYIVNPNLENEALDITMGEIGTELEKTKSKLINHRVWGKKRLAYQIENQKYGSFILLQFEGGEQDQMNEFNTWMKLNNSVLRHMTVALDEKPEVYVEKPEVYVEKAVEKETSESTVEETPANEAVVETTSEETETQSDVTDEESTEETETTEDASDESSEADTEEKEAE